jgi:hypothetical protein
VHAAVRRLPASVFARRGHRGDVDGALVGALALVGAKGHCAVALQLVDAPLGGVALLVPLGVEPGRSPTLTALLEAVGLLIPLDRDDRASKPLERSLSEQGITLLRGVLALAAAIWHNFQTGQAVSRSLTAYDH